jgi:hypothetical protein
MTKTETLHAGGFIVSEADGLYCREEITLLSGENVVAGEVLGAVALGEASAAAYAGNAANTGAMGAVTVGAGAKVGDYRLTIVEPSTNAGKFVVEDPDGVEVGTGTVGVAFSGGGLGFTLADGSTDFSAGEGFVISVAAGSGKYKALDLSGTVGEAVAAGIAFGPIDASDADAPGVAFVRGPAVVRASDLTWPSGITTDQKNAAIAELNALGIQLR